MTGAADKAAGNPGAPSPGAEPRAEKGSGKPRKRRRGLGILGLLPRLLLQLLLLILLLLGLVLGTQTGLRMAVALAEELAPEVIQVGAVDGRILGELRLTDLDLNLPGLSVDLGSLHLDWRPAALLRGTLEVATLAASDIDIVAEPGPEKKESEPFAPPEIRLPIGIDIGQVLIERLSFAQMGAPPESAIRLARAELSATANGDRVDLRRLQARLTQPQASAEAQGHARLTGDYPLELDISWQFEQAPALRLSGSGEARGDLALLDIHHRIDGSVELRLQAQVREVLSAPAWDGRIDLDAVHLPQLVPDAPPVQLTAELSTAGDLGDASVTGTLNGTAPDLPDLGELAARLDLRWAEQVLTVNALRVTETASEALLDLTGTVDLTGAEPAFDLAGNWQRLRWPLVGEILAESPRGELTASGELAAFRFALSTAAQGPQIPQAELRLSGTGSSADVQLDELLLETLGGRVQGQGKAAWSPELAWDLTLSAADLNPGRQWPGLDGKVALDATSSGGLDEGFAYQAQLDAAISAYPAAVLRLSGTGTAEQATLDQLRIDTLGGGVDGAGKVAWAPALGWDLQLTGAGIDPGQHYPGLDGQVGLELQSSGDLADGYDFSVRGDAALDAYPPAVVDIAGRGTGEAATLETLVIQALNGRLDGDAEVAWVPALSWRAQLDAADLDPGQVLADWPGRLGGRIESEGRIGDDGPDLTARIIDLGGELRGYPVRVEVQAGMQGETIDLRRLDASSGTTRLTADGRLAQQALDFRFDFLSPDLAALLPDAEGSLSAEGRVGGTVDAPSIALTLDGRDAELGGQGIERIAGEAEVALGPGGIVRIGIDGSNLIAGGQRFETLAIDGSGTMSAHRLSVDVGGDLLALGVALDGALGEAGAYRGSLGKLSLQSEQFGDWGLARPAPFSLDQGRISAGPLCIDNDADSGACASFEQPQPGSFDARLDAERIGLDVLSGVLPELLTPTGFVRADARFRGKDNRITGSARVQIPTGALELALPEAKESLDFSGTGADVRLDGAGLAATLAVPLQGVGRVDGKVSLPGFDPAAGGDPALRGTVDIRLQDLSRISTLVPDLTDITGGIDGDIRLAGRLSQPDIRGSLAVRQAGFRMPLFGLVVSDTNIRIQSQSAQALSLDGSALVGGGKLELDGAVRLGANGPDGKVRILGRDLKVADSKEYFALLSTDLRAGFGAGGTSVQGRLKVPEARIMPRSIPSGAVQPSPDVVMEDQAEQQEAVPLAIDITAELGDKVSIEAFGLRGKLRGSLRLLKAPNRDLVGDGQLEVVDGTYRVTIPGMGVVAAIGKPLTIEQGIVVFAKTPLDNPGLILNAQRESGDITAGVRVLGSLRNPKLAFFSESDPNLTQADITTYLVTGVPPKRGAAEDDRALSVGTYIAPKLFMEYESSLGEQSDKVKIRYDLTKSIELQTETGDSQAVGVFYKFEN